MSNSKMIIDKELIEQLSKLREGFKLDKPETIGETESAFDNMNYIEWLEDKINVIIKNAVEIQIDQSIEERAIKELVCMCDSCLVLAKNGLYVKGATDQHVIDQIKPIELLNERIAELNKADADFCKDRWDMTKPAMERNLYREESNKVTFARQELQAIKKRLFGKAD